MFDPSAFRVDLAHAMRASGAKGFGSAVVDALKAVAPPSPSAEMQRERATFHRDPVTKRVSLMILERLDGEGPVVTSTPVYDTDGYIDHVDVVVLPPSSAKP